MFYSHEILTSRKYGVATVWLMATVGSRSSLLRKLTRKAILDVDVPKACNTILDTAAPMALRLQSNLLFGVSRVYDKQCGYILSDAESAQLAIRALLNAVKDDALDKHAGKARPYQLLLPDDPAFLPDMMLPEFEMAGFDFSVIPSEESSLMSVNTPGSDHGGGNVFAGIEIPMSDSFSGPGGLMLPTSDSQSTRQKDRLGLGGFVVGNEDAFLGDVDFEFDEEGNMRDFGCERLENRAVIGTERCKLESGSGISERVRREHEEGLRAGLDFGTGQADLFGSIPLNFDDDLNLDISPPNEPFPLPGASDLRNLQVQDTVFSEAMPETSFLSSAEARMRRRKVRANKVIPPDPITMNPASLLATWNREYCENMSHTLQNQQNQRAPRRAKDNAAFWVFRSGIANVGNGIGRDRRPLPLKMFAGDDLMEMLGLVTKDTKREQEDVPSDGSDSEGRRLRQRLSTPEGEIARGDQALFTTAAEMRPLFDDADIEIGREAVQAMEEFPSSAMPWNISASARGSSIGRCVATGGFPTSAGAPSSQPASLARRQTGRLTSASPLLGRGNTGLRRYSSLEIPALEEDVALLEEPLAGFNLEATEEFEGFGPAAAVDTQTAADSQWIGQILDQEASNFFEFVQEAIKIHETLVEVDVEEETVHEKGWVQFERLLPVEANSCIVAAQGFLHMLTLATKNLLKLEQGPEFGDSIFMSVVGGV